MSSTKELSRAELVEQAFDCCMQAVRSYGPPLPETTRNGLVSVMEHFKMLALRDIGKEVGAPSAEPSLETARTRLAAIPDEIIKAEKYIKDLKMEQYQLAHTIRILEKRFGADND